MASSDIVEALRSELPALTSSELESLSVDDRRAETFLLYSTGWTQAKLARHFGLSQGTISSDLKIEMQRRRSRAANIDDEIERIAGVIENVMTKAWQRHNESAESNINSVAATNYLKLVMEAAEKYAHLRGFDLPRATSNAPQGKTRVVVQIGGSLDRPEIAVGLES